jgi:hypothetical protein
VDNLAPPAPDPFEAEYRADGVALHWLPSRAPDVAGYRLHRGAGVDFVPGDGTLVLAAPDTGFFDPGGGAGHVYKLAATDVHGNHGRFAIVSAAAPSAGPATPLPADLAAGRVALRWYLSLDDPLELAVQRRGPDEAWRALGAAAADGAGLVAFEDTGVEAGTRYGYRLALRAAGGPEWFAGERWVALPPAPGDRVLELPNPVAGGDVRVTFTAPPDQIVRVELFDLAGRVVATRHVPGGSGRGTVALARASDLAPGVYLVRVGLPVPAVARVVVIR